MPDRRFRDVLNTRLAKVTAILILALTVSPFTAPFFTHDSADFALEQVLQPADVPAKGAQDTADFVLTTPGTASLPLPLGVEPVLVTDRVDTRPSHVMVLRI
jgi:hypothetical protein